MQNRQQSPACHGHAQRTARAIHLRRMKPSCHSVATSRPRSRCRSCCWRTRLNWRTGIETSMRDFFHSAVFFLKTRRPRGPAVNCTGLSGGRQQVERPDSPRWSGTERRRVSPLPPLANLPFGLAGGDRRQSQQMKDGSFCIADWWEISGDLEISRANLRLPANSDLSPYFHPQDSLHTIN